MFPSLRLETILPPRVCREWTGKTFVFDIIPDPVISIQDLDRQEEATPRQMPPCSVSLHSWATGRRKLEHFLAGCSLAFHDKW